MDFFSLKTSIFESITASAATAYSRSLRGDSSLVPLWGCGRGPRIAAGDKQANTNTSFDEGVEELPKDTQSSIIRRDTGAQRRERLQSRKVNAKTEEEPKKRGFAT